MDIFKTGGFYYNFHMIKDYLWIFLISMVPLIELRGREDLPAASLKIQ